MFCLPTTPIHGAAHRIMEFKEEGVVRKQPSVTLLVMNRKKNR